MRWPKFVFLIPLVVPLAAHGDSRINGPQSLLAKADTLAMLYNWPEAASLYTQAESLFTISGDQKNALSARLGYLWSVSDSGVSRALKREITAHLANPVVNADARLRFRALVAKAALDRNENEPAARGPWKEIMKLATALGDKAWTDRAEAEVGQILYMDGDMKSAAAMLRDAIMSQYLHFDLGAAIHYTAMVGNGFVETGQPEAGLQYCNIVLKASYLVPDLGFPFLAYQGKARALLALHRTDEANTVLETAINRARQDANNFALAQLLIVAGTATAPSNPTKAIQHFKEANEISEHNGFQHIFAWSAFELAQTYRTTGNLNAAEILEVKALEIMRDIDDVSHLPQHLALLAQIASERGNYARSDQLYSEATDVMNGLLVNVVRRQLKSSLIATLSDAYIGHFELAATKFGDINKAFEIIEEARGRTVADTLRGESESLSLSSDEISIEAKQEITRIQLALMHETNPTTRESLLDQLFGVEQLLAPEPKVRSTLNSPNKRGKPVPIADAQSSLNGDEMLLEYVLGESQSYCLQITRSDAKIVLLRAGRKRISQLVEEYLASVRSRQKEIAAGQELFELLLQPVIRSDPKLRLIVVADGDLNLLPFDALIDDDRYVLESHVVTYAPSATVLHLLRSEQSGHTAKNFLGVGGVIYSNPTAAPSAVKLGNVVNASAEFFDVNAVRFPDLPGSKQEVTSIATVMKTPSEILVDGNDGGQGTGNGVVCGAGALVLGLIGLALGGLAVARSPTWADRLTGLGLIRASRWRPNHGYIGDSRLDDDPRCHLRLFHSSGV